MSGGLGFQVFNNGDVRVELYSTNQDNDRFHTTWTTLDKLEQFINAARAHLGQPVLTVEVAKLSNTLAFLGRSADSPGERRAYTKCAEIIQECINDPPG